MDRQRAHDRDRPSRRFAEALKLATELPEEERAALAEELWETVPDNVDAAAEAELRRRMAEMDAAEARGEVPGLVLSADEAIARATASRRRRMTPMGESHGNGQLAIVG